MKFRDESVKDIAVSESAVNDVVGALLFFTFLGAVKEATNGFTSIGGAFSTLFSSAAGIFLLKQIGIGFVVGFAGWLLLRLYTLGYKRKELSKGARGVALLSVPIVSFFSATALGGSGYLAAFIAGLLFHVSHERELDVEHYGENIIDGFAKPIIFTLLGAMVNLSDLGTYAVVGVLVALVFVFVLRPLMVLAMLGILGVFKNQRVSRNQLLFLSWIRETGAIPAVLLVTVVSQKLPGTEPLLPIGMWVILTTLILQPPLTPWWAKKLGIAEEDVALESLESARI
jgi:NhaP-type Na+/H+ or K+/H+ antiporter